MAQRVTNMLQTRAIQIIQDTEGLIFVGIGLEGSIVGSYAREKDDLLPEERALRVAVQAIEECGFVPDRDCLALDPAASEFSNAYREKTGEKDSVGQYLFWRAEDPKVLTTDKMVDLYIRWVKKYPIVSLEDPFAEDDFEGWKKLMKALDQEILIIGDDLVTTKDSTIRKCAEEGLINTALIKANQIGTLSETLLATRTAMQLGLALVASHRSKSPNEVMEADISFAVGALGLKCGGGANTERLVKYGRIVELMNMAKKRILLIQFRHAPHFFPPRFQVVAFQQDPNRFPSHSRNQFAFRHFLGQQAHRPARAAFRRWTTRQRHDALPMLRIQQGRVPRPLGS